MAALLHEARTRLPARVCGVCGRRRDALHVLRVGRILVCSDCFRSTGPPPPMEELAGEVSNGTPERGSICLESLRQADRIWRLASMVTRFAILGGLLLWSRQSPLGAAALTGYLVADAMAWVLRAAVDIHFHRVALSIELLLYGAAIAAWLSLDSTWTMPADSSDQAVLALSFFLTLTIRTGLGINRLLISDP